MPRSSKRSRAARQRWTQLPADQPRSSSTPPGQSAQSLAPPSVWGGVQPGVSSPCSSPAQKTAKLQFSPPATEATMAEQLQVNGTGRRHRAKPWPISRWSGRQHKSLIPTDLSNKKFALLVGDSHLRAIVDGYVTMPVDKLCFGVMSFPGAKAADLELEIRHAVVQHLPDVVCLLAPGNNLSCQSLQKSGQDFCKLLRTALDRWPTVCVLDFPPRLNVDVAQHNRLRQEFQRAAAFCGVTYVRADTGFPLTQPDLWCRDNVHLSDDGGMPILAQLLSVTAHAHLKATVQTAQVSPRTSPPRKSAAVTPPPVRTVSTRVVVTREVRASRSPVATTSQPVPVRSTQQVDLPEYSIPLNPVWFSPEILDAMDAAVPSHLPSPVESTAVPKGSKVSPRSSPRVHHSHHLSLTPPVRSVSPRVIVSREVHVPRSPVATTSQPSQPAVPLQSTTGRPVQVQQVSPRSSPRVHHSHHLSLTPPVRSVSPRVIVSREVHVPRSPVATTSQPSQPAVPLQSTTGRPVQVQQEDLPLWRGFPRGMNAAVPSDRPTYAEITAVPRGSKVSAVVHREQSTETQSHQPVQAVRASMCQGDIDQSNSQCTCMAVTFLAYHSEGMRYDTSSLDNVLRQGDALYKGLMQQHHFDMTAVLPHLTIEQMPKQVFTDGNTCYSVRLDLSDLRVGFVKPSAKDEAKASHMLLLEEELQCLSRDVTHAFLIVAPECFAVFRDTSGRYGLFDSHSRSSTGLSVPEGKAILLTFHDLLDLARHFDKIFKDRSSVEKYEFVPVSFEIDHDSSETRVQSGTVQPARLLPAIHDQPPSRRPDSHQPSSSRSPTTCHPAAAIQSASRQPASPQPPSSRSAASRRPASRRPASRQPQVTSSRSPTPGNPAAAIQPASQQHPACQPAACQPASQPPSQPASKLHVSELSRERKGTQEKQSQLRFQSVRATICQGDIMSGDTWGHNTQCTCMALTFLAYHNEGLSFDTASLDKVLHKGDGLYRGVIQQLRSNNMFTSYLLTMEQMPKQLSTDSNAYHVCLNMSNLRVGPLGKNKGKNLSLAKQLECLSQDVTHALLMVSPECFAVFRDKSGRYGLFDSHSRSATGLSEPQGKAIMLTFRDLSDLARHLRQILKGRRPSATYELMPVAFEIDHGSSETPEGLAYNRSKLNKDRRRRNKLKFMNKQRECNDQNLPPANKSLRSSNPAQYRKLRYRIPEVRLKKLKARKERWSTDAVYRETRKKNWNKRWITDAVYRGTRKNYQNKRYNTEAAFQTRQKSYIHVKYHTDVAFQTRQKSYLHDKYHTDVAFQTRQKRYLHDKYHKDAEFRRRHQQRCAILNKKRLDADVIVRIRHKLRCAMRIKRRAMHIVNRHFRIAMDAVMQAAIAAFRETIRHGPTYVCTVCHRALFANQVTRCNRDKYDKNPQMATACLTAKYVHVCNCECSAPCDVAQERLHEYICFSCHDHLKRGTMPPIAAANKLEPAPIPPELHWLNTLERQMIAKYLPFAKIISLPKGRQRAVHGAVVCVPSEVEATINALPRSSTDDQLLQVKLKRNIKYKGYQHFYTVNMTNVLAALRKLKETHPEYRDIVINEKATFDRFHDEQPVDEEVVQGETAADATDEQQPSEKEELRPGLTFDTCMQPPDIAQEILSYGEGIFSIAPAQGNRPVGVFTVPKLESMAFPVQFSTGQNTFDEAREIKLSPSRYFNSRLFSVDTRFATDPTYLFFAQFATETHMATNSMSIQTRKGKKYTRDGRVLSNKMLQDKEEVEKLIRNKDATRFMQPLRGTPAYWEKALRDLFAMCRQLGKPNWFITLSAAEMRWPEVIQAIKAQQGERGDYSGLDWITKCDILRSNPVTLMRMFEKRVDAAVTMLTSPARPVGQVVDYFFRVEFQQRGSPHIHMMVWVKGAPDPEDHAAVIKFIDSYVSCRMPDQKADPELHKIVSEVQVHSRNHSRSCKKGNVACRFGFPKLPMDETVITQPPPPSVDDSDDDGQKEKKGDGQKGKAKRRKVWKETMKQKEAKEKLAPLRDMLNDPKASFKDLSELLEKCKLSKEEYLNYVDDLSTVPVIHPQRHPDDCWVNAYNPHLLRVWDANMDIQFVLDESSCAQYMMAYVAKPEHEMSELLTAVVADVRKSKPDTKERDEMKHIMHAYVQHREVSAQESVARVCSLPLKKCTRQVIFIQTDEDGLKMSHPMSRLKDMDPDAQDVWMSGIPEKYLSRPEEPEFEDMCLAQFASEYRILYGRQSPGPNAFPLLNDMGFIQKRTNLEKVAVIRFTRFSEQKNKEKFYRRMLKLYLPHRADSQLKTESHPTYEQFYKTGTVYRAKTKLTRWPVKVIVDKNKDKYEGQGREMEEALQKVIDLGPVVHAWNTFAPEVEVDRLECISQRKPSDPHERQERDEVPDYQVHPNSSTAMPGIDAPELSPDYVRSMYRSLNETQASVFYTVRQWCCKRVWGHDPQPFFYFISGGAGCGKSHVIKCIYHEATKILRQRPIFRNEADMIQPIVLLTAFTGTAAFNISGKTLHSMLKLPRNLTDKYVSLGNALDDLRAVLANAEILIIDEISMVSKELFDYVDLRFQQIKGSRKPFGGMSVLAVGDFYQLPPVGRGKALCNANETVPGLWAEFQMVNLTEIMRQKDDLVFAELLNRLRVKGKKDPLSADDRALLTQAVAEGKDCPYDVLHVFATNKEVDGHNAAAISELGTQITTIVAQDCRTCQSSGKEMPVPYPLKSNTRELPAIIQVAQGARVMVIRNLDVEDGIVNGTFGTIANIVSTTANGQTVVDLLGLVLDNPAAGQNFRRKIQGPTDDLVYIERFEERLTRTSVLRRQFPMRLAFGCTAHKVQGMTMNSAVVSLKNIFQPGMAYVALSRTTSLQGLRITDFDEKKIYANPDITMAMERMNRASFQMTRPLLHFAKSADNVGPTLTIVHHNTEGLMSHIRDMKAHHEFRHADVLCMTETHLSGSDVPSDIELEGYHVFVRNRHASYTDTEHIASKKGGGVAVYYRSSLQADAQRSVQNVTDLEFAVVRVDAPVKALIATVYRPPTYKASAFCDKLGRLLESLALMNCQPIVVCGDFNEDLLKTGQRKVKEEFESKGYSQLISTGTTRQHTLIDHIYISQPGYCLQSGVLHTYYSYHDAVYCVLSSSSQQPTTSHPVVHPLPASQ